MSALTLGIILVAVLIVGGAIVVRRVFRQRDGVEPPPPEYEEAVQHLEELKTTHLWGDLPADLRRH